MPDINDLDALTKFFNLLLGEPGIENQTIDVVRAVGQGRAEVKPNTAHKLRPEDQHSLEIIIDSLQRTRGARQKANPPRITKEQI